jgi:predicted RNA-binding Zn-ribbon protein involved in translation (DUF1610 family)
MATKLKCPQCGKKAMVFKSKSELSSFASKNAAALAPAVIDLIKMIIEKMDSNFGKHYLVCENCGYWEEK